MLDSTMEPRPSSLIIYLLELVRVDLPLRVLFGDVDLATALTISRSAIHDAVVVVASSCGSILYFEAWPLSSLASLAFRHSLTVKAGSL